MAVNLKKVMTGIEAQYDGGTVGFAIAIYKSGVLKYSTSGGYAVVDVKNHPAASKKHSSKVRQSMGSMGKTISAAAMVHALGNAKKSIDDPISDRLPAGWKMGPNANQLTYRMVLTHTSGIPEGVYTIKQLRDFLAAGLPALPAPPMYANSNFDLTRILLPFVANMVLYQDGWEAMLGPMHINYVKGKVLEPCGLKGVDVIYKGPPPKTRYYASLNNPKVYNESNTLAEAEASVGAGWWTMSAREYGRLIDRLRHEKALPGVWKTMRDEAAATAPDSRLGMYRRPMPDGDAFWHNGGLVGGGESAWVAFPDSVTVVACANSVAPGAPQDVIFDAYKAALP